MTSKDKSKSKPIRRGSKSAVSLKPPAKKNQLVQLLSARAGCDVPSICETLGWQAHSTRAALSGLRKAGYILVTEKAARGKPARHRITTPPSEVSPRCCQTNAN